MAPLIVHILVALDLLLRRSDMVFMTGGEIADSFIATDVAKRSDSGTSASRSG
jgi:hypothetical protein